MQRWMAEQLSALSSEFSQAQTKYGSDFELMVRLGADTEMTQNAIKGPSVFRKTKDIEYFLDLPFDVIARSSEGRRMAAEFLLDGIRTIFEKAGIEVASLDEKRASIIDHLCSDPTMLDGPWPSHEGAKKGH